MPGSQDIAQAAWIRRVSVASPSTIDALPGALHEGEREAIALAKEQAAQLLIDERRARQIASNEGVEVIGTLRILDDAKRLQLINFTRPITAQMQTNGYRFDRVLIRRLLDRIGET